MKNFLYCVPLLALLSCSEKVSTPLQGQVEEDRIVKERRGDMVVLSSDEKIIRNDYSKIRSVINKREDFKILMLDENGIALKSKTLLPNQQYQIKVVNDIAKEALINVGDGFSIEKTVVKDGSTTFNIRTNADINENIYVSFVFTYSEKGVISKSPVKNTILPN